MNKLITILLCAITLIACTRTENGLVFGLPDYEKRNIKVSQTDLKILLKAKELLSTEENWLKNSQRACTGNPPFNLYCALKTASNIIDGKYIHRRPALQEVRFTIDDTFNDRWTVHRLADFNNHAYTSYVDVLSVLEITINRVKLKL